MSVTALDLVNNVVLARDMESSKPPAIDSQEHRNLVGKLVFFTALGVPDVLDKDGNGVFDVALREIDPLQHRGKASDNAWSSCASCHEDGHSDNVTWIFETGPRQTIPLEGMFTHDVPDVAGRLQDQRALNWSAVRGSNTDFNQNSIGIQGGIGFATETLARQPLGAGVQPRPGLRRQRLARRVAGVGDDDPRADRSATWPASSPAGGVRRELRVVPRRCEVDQEPGHCKRSCAATPADCRRRSRAIRSAPASSSWMAALRASSRSTLRSQ